jgi:hypothetical protein
MLLELRAMRGKMNLARTIAKTFAYKNPPSINPG